jgi:hypothetical protein
MSPPPPTLLPPLPEPEQMICEDDIQLLELNNNNIMHINKLKQWLKSILFNNNTYSLYLCIVACYLVSFFRSMDIVPIVMYKANAFSSFAYALISAPIQIRIPLMILAVASFTLWANTSPQINFIDVTCIYWVIIIVTLTLLPNAKHSIFVVFALNIGFFVYIATILGMSMETLVLNYYRNNLVEITGLIYGLSGATVTSFYVTNKIYIIGVLLTAVGFICKMLTIYAGQYWGTCIFHMMTAYGIHVLLQIRGTK